MTIYILIPAYEPNEKLGQLTKELIPAFPVTIVDDGSGEAYLDVFRHAEELGATILRHDINRDKGAALKTGIAAIMQREADGMRVFLMLLPAGQSYAAARFFSAALNYYLNCRLVFGGRPTVSNFVGYALLALVLLTIGSVAVGLFASMVMNKVLAKLSIDPALFLFNYAMQKRWSGRLSAGKTVKFKFLGTGMISVMPVPLLAAHPRECIANKVVLNMYLLSALAAGLVRCFHIDDGFRILGVPQADLQHAHSTMKRAAFNKRGGFLHDFVAHEYASFDL